MGGGGSLRWLGGRGLSPICRGSLRGGRVSLRGGLSKGGRRNLSERGGVLSGGEGEESATVSAVRWSIRVRLLLS
eukprot:scaffold60687_cov21-Phaeocystis_antarctica.AAC.1